MVQINFATREVSVKIVYYGPGRSGKTTNLQKIFEKAPPDSKGELISIATETDRTLYFDFLPLDLGKIAGMTTKFQLYTVPGQVYYNATRKLVLQGADGVVFVADSQRKMKEENEESLENLEENLEENGLDINEIPLVFQWNKRDLDDVMSVEELNASLNRWNAPACEAVALKGEGVFKTLKLLASLVIKKLNREHGFAEDGVTRLPAGGAKPAAAAPAAAPKPAPAQPKSSPVRLAGSGPAPAKPAAAQPAKPVAGHPPKPAAGRPPKPVPAQARPAPAAAPGPAPSGPQATPPPTRPAAAQQGGGTPPSRQAAPAPPAAATAQAAAKNPLSLEIQRRKEQMARQRQQREAQAAQRSASPQKGRKKGKGGLVVLILLLLLAIGGGAAAYLHFVMKLF